MSLVSSRNLLLRSLGRDDAAFLMPRLQRVPLSQGHVIVGKGEPITFVCFPECGVTSIADVMSDGTRVEVALIGREGMTNSQLVLGEGESAYEAIVQIGGGTSLRLEADDLRTLCTRSSAPHSVFLGFVHGLEMQTAKTLACNALYPTETRLARWLLMCHDRVDGDEIRLTHASIAKMLAVRRATVTETIQILEGEGALKNRRGCTQIRDRTILERIARNSYDATERSTGKLTAAFGESKAPTVDEAEADVEEAGKFEDAAAALSRGRPSRQTRIMYRTPPPTGSLAPTDLLVTKRLSSRLARTGDLRAELDAFRELSVIASQDADRAVQRFLDLAVELCPAAGSAGLSELEVDENGAEVFRWTALAGELAPYVGGTTPRDFSPCGLCLAQGMTILVERPARVFSYFETAHVPIVEGLIVPLYDSQSEPLGTLWVTSHREDVRGFDSTDARVMERLAAQLVLSMKLQRLNTRMDGLLASAGR